MVARQLVSVSSVLLYFFFLPLNALLVVVDKPDYQVVSDKIIYHFKYCSPTDRQANVSIYSTDLLNNLSFHLWPNECKDLVLKFKKKNLVSFDVLVQTDQMKIKQHQDLFFTFELKPEDILKTAEIKADCFNGSCVVKGFYEFKNVIDDVKVETPFHIYTTKNNLSFEEKFYIGQSKSFDYYNNIYYAGDMIKRKIKVFNRLPEKKEVEEVANKTQKISLLPQDTNLTTKQKIVLVLFIFLLILNFSWDFLKAKIKTDEVESNES